MAEAIITVTELSKRFFVRHERRPSVKSAALRILRPFPTDVLWALREVSFAVAPGEAVGLVGSNGSGKSTLLRLIAGIFRPTSGTITMRGRAGGLFELAAGFHPELTGAENIRLSGALLGFSPRAVAERWDEIAEFSELGDFLDVRVKHYSSGMGLRLGFAVAVVWQPQALLVDEVLAVADAHFQQKVYQRLRQEQAQGRAILLVSHEMTAIREMTQRVLWLEQGRIEADGPTDEVIAQYLAHARSSALPN